MLAGIVSNDKNLTWNRVFDIAEEAGHIDGIPLPVLQAIRNSLSRTMILSVHHRSVVACGLHI